MAAAASHRLPAGLKTLGVIWTCEGCMAMKGHSQSQTWAVWL